MANTKAIIITIGDELLIGQTIDTNSAWIAQQLNKQGIDVVKRVAVGDNKPDIIKALDEEISQADIILLTGGLGPTSDDITKPLLCEYFGGRLVVNERVLEHVKDIFAKRNRPFIDRNMKQAEVPDVCTVLFNRKGTAPGMLFNKEGKLIISMPGVPFEMMAIMEDEVLPLLARTYSSDALIHKTLITVGEGESFIAEKIEHIENELPPHIKLAYLPSPGMVKLRLTGRGTNTEELDAELQQFQDKIVAILGRIVIAKDDLSIEKVLGQALAEKNATLSLAESCTGGYISHLVTQVPGASEYYKGGVVSYLIDVKENVLGVSHDDLQNFGAVCEPVAIQMAEGVRNKLNSDYSISVTGVLGPGVDDGRNPVGTVWIAVSSADKTIAKEHRFWSDRIRNKELAATMGMLMLLRFINGTL